MHAASFLSLERRLAVKKRLVESDHVVQACIQGSRKSVRVLTDNQMPFLQAKNALGFDAKRSQAKIPAGVQERFPQMPSELARTMNLVAQLSHEADSQQSATNTGHIRFSNRHIGEGAGRQVLGCEGGENVSRLRSREIDG